ncbi:MAG: hypothetical protein ROO71_02810 [Balneola sp.]
MSGFDPFLIEQKFNETVRLIQSSPSERIQITCIDQFIREVWEFRSKVSSYLEQLMQYLPNVSSPLLLAGVDPEVFEEFIHQIQSISEQFDADVTPDQKIVEYRKSLRMLRSWLGERPDEGTGNIIQLDERSKPDYKPGEVLIPVVEELKTTEGNTGIGRLRQLRVDILGENKKGKSELKPAFGVVGKDTGSFLDGVANCSEKLLSVSKKGKHKHWKATASLSMSHAWHAGRSANLALAAAFYCEMLKAEEIAEFFRLNPAICVSGDVDEFGNVLAVEEESLELKTEAAFFSWVQVLVVPADQLNQVQQKISNLKERFPNRELPVFGVNKIEEIFYDRRLTIHHKADAIVHNFRKVWKRKFSVASVITVLVLLGIIARLLYGPVDRNPTHATYEGEYAYIRNASGAILKETYVGEYLIRDIDSRLTSTKEHIQFRDINKDGINEVLENRYMTHTIGGKRSKEFLIYNIDGDTLLKKDFFLDIRFDNHPYIKEAHYNLRLFHVEDYNVDLKDEILFLLHSQDYFSQVFSTMSLDSKEITNGYINAGYLRDFMILDLDSDGVNEILIAADIKVQESSALIVLDSRFINGTGILGDRYKKTDMRKAVEKAVILIPQTILGREVVERDTETYYGYSLPKDLSFKDNNIIKFANQDWNLKGSLNGGLILFEFFTDLSLRSIVSGDDFDAKAKEYYEQKLINFELDALFLDTYRDSLQYWNGTEFQYKPTLNKKYLETVGDDSMFYKEFYFKNND